MLTRHTKRFRVVIALVAVAASLTLLVACGGSKSEGDTTTGMEPAAPAVGSGLANVTLATDPEPLVTNQRATVTVRLTDADGNGVDGATVGVVAEHAEMSMGKITGVVEDAGGGTFTTMITPSMAGPWKVTVTAEVDGTTKQATFEVPVE